MQMPIFANWELSKNVKSLNRFTPRRHLHKDRTRNWSSHLFCIDTATVNFFTLKISVVRTAFDVFILIIKHTVLGKVYIFVIYYNTLTAHNIIYSQIVCGYFSCISRNVFYIIKGSNNILWYGMQIFLNRKLYKVWKV